MGSLKHLLLNRFSPKRAALRASAWVSIAQGRLSFCNRAVPQERRYVSAQQSLALKGSDLSEPRRSFEPHLARHAGHLAAVLLLVSGAGCSRFARGPFGADGGLPAQSTVANDVANASRGVFKGDVKKDSESMHHFLVGQLSLGAEDYDGALKHFEEANLLSSEPSACIQTKLADLYVRFGELAKARVAAERALAEDPSDPYVRMLYAGVLEGLGDDAKAEPIYRSLVNDYPAKVDGYLLLAHLQAKQGNVSAAEGVLETLVRNQPQEPTGHLYLGRVYESQGKLPKAEKEFEWLVQREASFPTGFPELMRVLIRQNKLSRAKHFCDTALQKDPSNALARKVLSFIMIGESKLDQALEHLTALTSLEEDPSDTRFKVALIQIEKQNYREAIRELSLVLAKNPKHDEARYYLASLYAGTGRRREAIEELNTIKKDSAMYVKAKAFATFILRQDNDLDGALEAVDDALEVQPDNVNLILYGVAVLRDLREYRDAESRLRKALERLPDNERVLFNLALVLHERGKDDEASALMERIAQSNPQNSDALNFVAYALAQRGVELDRAQRLVMQALEVRSNDGFYLDTLGFIYFKQGKLKDAEEVLSRAVGSTGQDPVIIEHYVSVLLALNKQREAVAILKSVTEAVVSEEDESDKAKHDAKGRLKRLLKDLLERQPELRTVPKAHNGTQPQPVSATPLSALELLREASHLGEDT